eukprot:TRINITY_DN10054_c0_g2_i11.p1 TRINITY_DN10054_c0_g2~~TRINITY_DN10054_c0_g2_i11.p1  ORF type:complete len:606 (+),score=117.29 TRINITY_DN10054_c0_g2_i11:166-1983(+)
MCIRDSSLECDTCRQEFASRNKLFKHLKESSCSVLAPDAKNIKIAIMFGYTPGERENAIQAILGALDSCRPEGAESYAQAGRGRAQTCATAHEQRSDPLLRQEAGACAVADVLSVGCERLPIQELTVLLNSKLPAQTRVFGCVEVPLDFHAEYACIRRYYEITVPTSAVFDPSQDHTPDLSSESRAKKHKASDGILGSNLSGGTGLESAAVRLGFFQRLKHLMRQFHSSNNNNVTNKKRWHNFTVGAVATDASVLRTVGRFQHVKTLRPEQDWATGSLLLLSCCADSFLVSMLRKMLSVIIAAAREFISQETFDYLLSDLGVLPEIPIPELSSSKSILMLAEVQFNKKFLEPMVELAKQSAAAQQEFKQFRILSELADPSTISAEYSRFIEQDLIPWAQAVSCKPALELRGCELANLTEPPAVYHKVLSLLRDASRGGSWPRTTEARARLIQDGQSTSGDSFSLGLMPPPLKQPTANKVFPELMQAAFELEGFLFPGTREPSSTIAVNRNALFLPHTDNGAGAGQGISMIVALGDFIGGEVVVEGEAHQIRYSPVEFNGWTQRHWTLPFQGERFSLVFFTPLGCETNGLTLCSQLKPTVGELADL